MGLTSARDCLSAHAMHASRQRLGRHEDATQSYYRAIRIYEKLFGPTHPSTATAFSNLAVLQRERAEADPVRAPPLAPWPLLPTSLI